MICLYWVKVSDWKTDRSRIIKVEAENRKDAYFKVVFHLKDSEYVVSVD